MKHEVEKYLLYILEAAQDIQHFTTGLSFKEYEKDKLTKAANVSDPIVWDVVQNKLPFLMDDLSKIVSPK
ncbi:MAG: hypothetical protein R2830_02200 [Saprospiraceae bacterium]